MKLTGSISHRLAAAASLASITILLPAAALAASAGPASAGPASAMPASLAAPACTGAHTRVWLGLPADHAAGNAFYQIQISNIGHSACTVSGFPAVWALDGHFRRVGLAAVHDGGQGSVITMAPGGTAHVVLDYSDVLITCAHPKRAPFIGVRLPGQSGLASVPVPTLACPGTSVLGVDAVHPGAGIPDYSAR